MYILFGILLAFFILRRVSFSTIETSPCTHHEWSRVAVDDEPVVLVCKKCLRTPEDRNG